jgi:inositol-1,4,5-trisphosphate 5-phosphatase
VAGLSISSVEPSGSAATTLLYGKFAAYIKLYVLYSRLLMSSEELRLFDKVRVYLDEDYSSAENFTVSMKYYFM